MATRVTGNFTYHRGVGKKQPHGGDLGRAVSLAIQLRQLEVGLSMRELAARVGVTHPYLAKRYSYQADFTVTDLENLSEALGVSAEWAIAAGRSYLDQWRRFDGPPEMDGTVSVATDKPYLAWEEWARMVHEDVEDYLMWADSEADARGLDREEVLDLDWRRSVDLAEMSRRPRLEGDEHGEH